MPNQSRVLTKGDRAFLQFATVLFFTSTLAFVLLTTTENLRFMLVIFAEVVIGAGLAILFVICPFKTRKWVLALYFVFVAIGQILFL